MMPKRMKEEYKPENFKQKMGYLIEECGEVLTACGKTVRWGVDGYNLELPVEEQESNGDWLLRELKDLKRAIKYMEKHFSGRD